MGWSRSLAARLALACLVAGSPAPRAAAADAHVLMLGNSYTQQNDLDTRLKEVLVDAVPGWTEVGHLKIAPGGYTLAGHAANADGSNGDTPTRQALVTGPQAGTWDWVILQDQSQTPGFPQTEPMWQASRDGAVILHGLIGDGDGETVLLLTWGRRDGDPQNPAIYPDFSAMQQRLLDGYLAYAEAASSDGRQTWIAPAGLAFARVHDELVAAGEDPTAAGSVFHGLYSNDGSHPSVTGSYLAALTIAAAVTGRPSAPGGRRHRALPAAGGDRPGPGRSVRPRPLSLGPRVGRLDRPRGRGR